MGKNEKNDYYFGRKFLSHKMSEYKFWVVKNGELHLFRNPHENFEPDSSEMEWGVLKNINFHDDEKTTWKNLQGDEEEEEKEEEDCVHNFYLCKFCCSEYDETEVDCKHCGRNRCVFLYQAKNKSEAIEMTKE